MAENLWVTAETRGGDHLEVKVVELTTVGVIVDLGGADETIDILIPWHRVWEVYSNVEGAMSAAFESVTGK